ncbi:SH3 domain-containing protein [Peribacillus asahii]|uniref:SH3 domain-containing protein n=1 Tax=Peribacillus asahii TaxID=228899 RepID=A0A398BA83_9BACI|nr:SH3 domain-containing protein [Peribacillus asahii]
MASKLLRRIIVVKKLLKVCIIPILILSFFSFNSSNAEAFHSSKTTSTEKAFVKIKSGTLTVRSGEGTKYKKIGSLKKGAEVAVYSTDNFSGWSKIKYKGKKAYVATKYIKFADPFAWSPGIKKEFEDAMVKYYVDSKDTLRYKKMAFIIIRDNIQCMVKSME